VNTRAGPAYETRITRAILDVFHEKLSRALTQDVLVVGAGPSGLMAAITLATRGRRVTVLEKRLAPGGGLWGGAMGMNEVVLQDEALVALEGLAVKTIPAEGGLFVVDAVGLASTLCAGALEAGATILNLVVAEDLCTAGARVVGVVANRTGLAGNLPIDPISFRARAVVDATGHEAALVNMLQKRRLLSEASTPLGEGCMNPEQGEAFVVDRVQEVYPGLWVTGMTVAAVYGGPRMGPIFGGMLLSGQRVGKLVHLALDPEGRRERDLP
jgi:sulfide-dependent adenosine diphosphate thiazole synthase